MAYDKKMAKMDMLKDLKKSMMMDDDLGMKEKMMQKVTVAADSEKGLEKGLSKAQEILKKKLGDKMPKEEEKCGECGKASCECDGEEYEEEEDMMDDYKDMSKEEIKEKIEYLKKMLDK